MQIKLTTKKQLILGGLLVMIIFTSFYLNPTLANDDDEDEEDDEDEDGIGDEEESINERDLDIDVDDYEARIESDLRSGSIKNELRLEIGVEDEGDTEEYGLEFKLTYKQNEESSESQLKFKITILDIIEYIDQSSEGVYNASTDQLLQTYRLNNFVELDYITEIINGTTVHSIVAETEDGVFKATTYIAGEFVLINDILISPVEVKIDIEINNFNYTDLSSQLALKVLLEDKLDDEDEDEDDEDEDDVESGEYEEEDETEDEEEGRASDEKAIVIQDSTFSGFFSWIEIVSVDGVDYPVKISPLNIESDEQELLLNYPRGDAIIHDPKIGVEGILKKPDTGIIGEITNLDLPVLSRNELLIASAISLLVITSLVVVFRKELKTD